MPRNDPGRRLVRRALRLAACACVAAAAHGPLAGLRAEDAPLTLTLREAVEIARRESPGLRAASLQSAEAAARVDVARAATLPQIGVQATNGYQTSNLEGIGLRIPGLSDRVGPFQQFDARPTITHPLFALDLHRQVRVAAEGAAHERWREEVSRETISLAVVEGYLQVLEAEARWESATARLRTADALLADARRFVEVGTASRLDEARALLRRETERAVVTNVAAEREIRKRRLLALLGLPPASRLALADRLQAPSDAELSRALGGASGSGPRPELEAAQAQLRGAVAERRKVEAERLPSVAVSGDFGLFGRSLGSNLRTYSVYATVRVPLYEGGRIEAGIRSAALKTLAAEEAVREARIQMDADVEVARIEVEAAFEAHAAAAAAAGAGRTAVDLSRARFAEGLSTNIEVVSAQEALAAAEAAEIGQRYRFHSAGARLARARGNVLGVFDN